MKVYRLIPDSFLSLDRRGNIVGLNETDNIGIEDIYYNIGYVTLKRGAYWVELSACEIDQMLIKEEMEHKNNDINKKDKFFFIFKEDPIIYSQQLSQLCNCKPLYFSSGSGRLVEYDIPEEIVMKYYAPGTYGPICGYCSHELAAECYVKEDNFKGEVMSSNKISIEDKIKALIKPLKQTLDSLIDFKKNYNESENEIYKYFSGLFNVKDLNEVVNDEKKLKEILFNSLYYENFVKAEVKIVETPYITGKVLSSPIECALNYRFARENKDYFLM